jgi:hypothetical protein
MPWLIESYRESVIFNWGSVLYLQLHSFWELFAFVCFQLCYWFSDAVTLINVLIMFVLRALF